MKECIIYPDNFNKIIWDIIICIFLVMSCILTPVDLAYPNYRVNSANYSAFLYFIDFVFFFDLIVTFFSAYEDYELKIQDDLKDIALNYLKGWFIIDFVSILPLDLILSSISNNNTSGYKRFFRFIRLGKLQILFRVIKSF